MTFDPEHQALNQAVGFALSHWAGIEFELCAVFRQALSPQFPDAAISAFYSVRSFDTRLDMTNGAMRHLIATQKLPTDRAAEWKAIYNKCGSRSKKRNQLAHSCIVRLKKTDGSIGWYLEPYPQMYHPERNHEESYLTAHQIHESAASFSRLAVRLSKFEQALAAHLGARSISRLRDNGPPPVARNAAGRSHKAKKRPPRSSEA